MDMHKIKLFSDLQPEVLEHIKSLSQKRIYPKDTTVFVRDQETDGIYIIYAGRVKVTSLYHDGREKILAILGEGEILGEMTLWGSNLRSANVETMEVTTFLIISRANFRLLLESLPGLSLKVIELLSERLRQAVRQIEELTFLDARRRVIGSLIYLSDEKKLQTGPEAHIVVSMTHAELANLTGVTRETVTKVLNELQDEKVISTSRRQIRVLNPATLREQLL